MKKLAHDMRNLLAVIEGQSELGERACLELIGKAGAELSGEELTLALAQLAQRFHRIYETGAASDGMLQAFFSPTTIAPGVFDLNKSIRRVIFMIGENLNFIRPELKLCEAAIPIQGDWLAFCRLLTNLCMNARNAIGASGRVGAIVIETALDQNAVAVMSVSDNGCGMTDKMVSNIWAPRVADGEHGHGMCVVGSEVETLGGKVSISTECNVGSTFFVRFPMAGSVAAPTPTGAPIATSIELVA